MNHNLDLLSKYISLFPYHFKNIPREKILEKPNPKKWSKKEILGHLVDSGVYNLERFTNIRVSPQPFEIIPYPQDGLVKANDYQNTSVDQILNLWTALNQQILNVWKKYSKEEYKLKIIIPQMNQTVDLEWWINDYREHMEHHFKQIFGSLDTLNPIDWQVTLETAKTELSKEAQKRFVTLLEHGSMYVEYYAPIGKDLQTPHEQDELYVIASGSGTFFYSGKRHAFKAGDVLFVPAGIEHRFEKFSADFATWVIFYGPKGGERPVDKSD